MISKKLFKKAAVFAVFLLFVGTSVIASPGNTVFNGPINTSSEILMVDETTIELTITSPTFEFGSIPTEEGMFATVELPGEGFTTIVGEARLPTIKHMLEIPQGADPEIIVTSVSWESTSLNELDLPARIVPVQPSVLKIPGATEEFVIDNQYYLNNAFTPSPIAKVADIGVIRGRRFALVEVSPIQYNPSSGEIKTITDCDIVINLPGSDMTQTYEKIQRYSSPRSENFFKTAFANYGFYENGLENRDQEGYLIIVYDSFYDEIQPLASWKQSKGLDITVTKTSQIPGGATKDNIKNYIQDAYDNWAIPPSYVLLVGDDPQIPTFTGQSSNTAADLYYVTVDGSDYFPDIYIGRFPASQESHVTTMVDKTVYYEQGIFPSIEWIKKAAFMASVDNYQISEGTHNYVIDNFLDPNGYTCDKLYQVTYGATTQDVRDALNDGRSLAIYSGHGSTTSWADGPPFSQSDVNNLMNEDMYPLVCSHACVTGKFTVGECFGETWLRAPNKAALAFWGSSANTYWDEDDILEKEVFSAWWDDGLEWIGGMTDMGLYYLYQYYSGGGLSKYYFECYNILGDPSVIIWSDEPNPNLPPDIPGQPDGPTQGVMNKELTFSGVTTDPEGEQIYYMFDWGDNTSSYWVGPYDSGVAGEASHVWTEPGDYEIRVKAKDINGSESDWSIPLTVTIVEGPILDMGLISGGIFRVNAVIRNIGATEATNVTWNMTLSGTILIGRESNGEIPSIPADGSATATSGLIMGFGKTTVTVTAEIPEGSDTRSQGGTVLLFFIIINPSGG